MESLNGKYRGFILEPCPLLVDQIDTYLKKMFESNKDKYWPNKIEIGFESLVYALRMNSYIESRNWKKMDVSLNKCIEIAMALGWLLKHESAEGKTIKRKEIFYLNKEKFEQISKEKTTNYFY